MVKVEYWKKKKKTKTYAVLTGNRKQRLAGKNGKRGRLVIKRTFRVEGWVNYHHLYMHRVTGYSEMFNFLPEY